MDPLAGVHVVIRIAPDLLVGVMIAKVFRQVNLRFLGRADETLQRCPALTQPSAEDSSRRQRLARYAILCGPGQDMVPRIGSDPPMITLAGQIGCTVRGIRRSAARSREETRQCRPCAASAARGRQRWARSRAVLVVTRLRLCSQDISAGEGQGIVHKVRAGIHAAGFARSLVAAVECRAAEQPREALRLTLCQNWILW
jgi:hypothetical protein